MLRKNAVNVLISFILLLSFAFLILTVAEGSMPVEKILDGCVIGGRFFSVYKDSQTSVPSKAYPIRIENDIDLSFFEGKAVSISGSLLPGDRFFMKKGDMPKVVDDVCGNDYMKVIKKELIMEYRVAGYMEAKKNNFEEALKLVNWALEMDKTLCDTFISRAQIYCLKGDFVSGMADIKAIKNGVCIAGPQGHNFIILEEIGLTLEKSGRNSDALEVYKLGLAACQSDMCIEAMNKNISKLNQR
ncbi:MAG: hypothetical protein KBA98_10245 [Syntrophorhabdaceae bacterium]|nr:hypothetical protein [Syntrophorhabdaceae bacterium]HQO64795.1 hypothetical protein [Syntrophorhabdus sp.]